MNPFNTLKHLSVDFVKIDGSYTQDLSSPENLEALKVLLASLHAQARLTIVPFVETATTMAALWQTGVNYIQGYHVQEPEVVLLAGGMWIAVALGLVAWVGVAVTSTRASRIFLPGRVVRLARTEGARAGGTARSAPGLRFGFVPL